MYTVEDIMDKLIDIEIQMNVLYSELSEISKNQSFKILAKVMAKEESRHAEYFLKIKKTLKKEDNIEIDFTAYDKISQRIYEFKNKIYKPEFEKVHELLYYILNFEKEMIALLMDIRGRLIKTEDDINKESYKILSELIKEEQRHVANIKPYC